MVDPAAKIEECYGSCKGLYLPNDVRNDGKTYVLFRDVDSYRINLTQAKDDRSSFNPEQHGLAIYWYPDGKISVNLNKNGKTLGDYMFNTNNWTVVEGYSRNKEVFDNILSIEDFRP